MKDRPQIGAYVPPRTPTESTLAAIWSELLSVEPVGIEDRFVELGGDSLIATLLAVRVRDELSVELTPSVLFKASTVRELADCIESVRLTQGGAIALADDGEDIDEGVI